MAIFSYLNKKTIFLSYSHKNRKLARDIAYGLRVRGHTVFFDDSSLAAGQSFHDRIYYAINNADTFIFLISPDSLAPGCYAMAELEVAMRKWPNPSGNVLPVMVEPTPDAMIPSYLKVVTILKPRGNIEFSVGNAIEHLSGRGGAGGGGFASRTAGSLLPSVSSLPTIDFSRYFKRRRVFIAFVDDNASRAKEVSMALRAQGHDVLWDKAPAASGQSYDPVAHQALNAADTFIFLISPAAVKTGSPALGYLSYIQNRWPRPKGRVIGVAVSATKMAAIPTYLRANLVSPQGNLGLEVGAALEKSGSGRQLSTPLEIIMGAGAGFAGWGLFNGLPNMAAQTFFVAFGILLGLVLAIGMLLTGRHSVRQGFVVWLIAAIAGGVVSVLIHSYVLAGPEAYQDFGDGFVVAFTGLAFGFFTQLGLAMTVPNLRYGAQWFGIPATAALFWTVGFQMGPTPSLLTLYVGAIVWMTLLSTWVGHYLRIGGGRG